jgi:hypothetical protein
MSPLQGGPCEGVEDPAATAALEVHHRRAMAAVNPQALPLRAAWARQAIGVEQFHQFGVARVLVQIIEQGEVHDQNLHDTRNVPIEDTTARSDRQETEHLFPLMSLVALLAARDTRCPFRKSLTSPRVVTPCLVTVGTGGGLTKRTSSVMRPKSVRGDRLSSIPTPRHRVSLLGFVFPHKTNGGFERPHGSVLRTR